MKIYVVLYVGPFGEFVHGPYTSQSEAVEAYYAVREEVRDIGGRISLVEHYVDEPEERSCGHLHTVN